MLLLISLIMILTGCVHSQQEEQEDLVRVIKKTETAVFVGYEIPQTRSEYQDILSEIRRIAYDSCMDGYDLGRITTANRIERWTTVEYAGTTTACGWQPTGTVGTMGVTGMNGISNNLNCVNNPVYQDQQNSRAYVEYRRWIVCREDDVE